MCLIFQKEVHFYTKKDGPFPFQNVISKILLKPFEADGMNKKNKWEANYRGSTNLLQV